MTADLFGGIREGFLEEVTAGTHPSTLSPNRGLLSPVPGLVLGSRGQS